MARPRLGPTRQPWKGIDANERAYNTVHNALVGIILDGVTGVSPDLGHRQIAPEKADEYLDRARRVLADFESQNPAPGGQRGRGQFWMENKIRELKRLLADAEAVRSGAQPQKQTPESYSELRKHLGLQDRPRLHKSEEVKIWGIWDATRRSWLPDAMRGAVDSGPARYRSKEEAERAASEWRGLNPDDSFEVRRFDEAQESRRYPKPSAPPRRFVAPRANQATEPPKATNLDRILDRVERGKREVTLDTDGYTQDQVDRVIAAAKNRGFHAAYDGRFVLIRDLGHDGVREAPHRVADFNTLDDLIDHAGRELGATHVTVAGPDTRIYFPRGGQYPYEEARVWRKGGYWHAEGPGARRGVNLPRGAKPILRRDDPRHAAAETRGVRDQAPSRSAHHRLPPRKPQ